MIESLCPCLSDCFREDDHQPRAAPLSVPLLVAPHPAPARMDLAGNMRRPYSPVHFPPYQLQRPSSPLAQTHRARKLKPQTSSLVYPVPCPLKSVTSGRKKALLIGITYPGTALQLKGCIWDVHRIQRMLHRFGFAATPQSVLVLTDDTADTRVRPTRGNILRAMQWLVSEAAPGDSLFLYFSGHGSQVPDLQGDEDDGLDETLVPCDWHEAGQITDDEIYKSMVVRIPKGARLTCLMDCCHSGSLLDLPFTYVPHTSSLPHGSHSPHTPHGRLSCKADAVPLWGDVIVFSGCTDEQESADVSNVGLLFPSAGNGPGGAMTNAFIYTLERNPRSTIMDVIQSCALLLKTRMRQLPVLSASRPFDLLQPFTL
eukprot:TRINITY_DN10275_c0_g1_i1.p1 TRINITY_DN10275_c0_g1~~TRINITY_DN10275_c0_g1_i1.p1  ORF type:complete len:371 (-),score=36.26 TRINITY_DN10275_c0_g1_i1:165-1277(-)